MLALTRTATSCWRGFESAPVYSTVLLRAAAAGALVRVRSVHLCAALRAAPKAKRGGVAAAGAGDEHGSAAEVDDAVVGDIADPALVKVAMAKSIEHAKREFAKLRGGTATPQMLDHITVEAYGERQPLSALAQATLKSPQLFVVSPFDTANLSAVSNAIRDGGLNLNPSVDGSVVKVPIPKPSKETRDMNAKLVSKVAEAAKASIRRMRQAALDKLKKLEGVSSDDVFRQVKEVQAVANAATDEVTRLADKKKAEIESA